MEMKELFGLLGFGLLGVLLLLMALKSKGGG